MPEIARLFGIAVRDLDDWLEAPARYNIAPQTPVVVVRAAEDRARQGAVVRWGLVPSWAEDASIGARMFNARLEGVRERSAYRSAYARRRCLVPASAFYEWRKGGAVRQPFAFRAPDDRPLALAGIWEVNRRVLGGGRLDSVSVITTEARGAVASLHDRMPLILPEPAWPAWLDPETAAADVDAIAAQGAGGDPRLRMYPVTARMNSARFEDPSCLEAVAGETP